MKAICALTAVFSILAIEAPASIPQAKHVPEHTELEMTSPQSLVDALMLTQNLGAAEGCWRTVWTSLLEANEWLGMPAVEFMRAASRKGYSVNGYYELTPPHDKCLRELDPASSCVLLSKAGEPSLLYLCFFAPAAEGDTPLFVKSVACSLFPPTGQATRHEVPYAYYGVRNLQTL